jgi:hypothetical protein
VDAILDPMETRRMLILSLEVATRVRDENLMATGVFQV